MKRIFGLILVCSSLLLAGCGGKSSEKTNTTLTIGGMAGTSAVGADLTSGGVILLAANDVTQHYIVQEMAGTLSTVLELENGSWVFLVLAWDGVDPMTGTMRCGHLPMELSGGDMVANILVNADRCQLLGQRYPEFKDATTGNFLPLRFHTCSGLIRDIQREVLKPGPVNFSSGGIGCDDEKGKERSFRMLIPQFDVGGSIEVADKGEFQDVDTSSGTMADPVKDAPNLTFFSSACIDGMASTDAFTGSNIIWPVTEIPVVVVGYDQAGCTGDERYYGFFERGLQLRAYDQEGLGISDGFDAIVTPSVTHQEVLLDSIICSGSPLSGHPFAYGAYNASGVNHICTKAQLANLDPGDVDFDPTWMGGEFMLGGDIDLNADEDGDGVPDPFTNQIGDNATNKFTGRFKGRDFILKNGTVPLFVHLGSNAYVEDIVLDGFQVAAGAGIKGMLAEGITSVSNVTVDEVVVTNSDFTGAATSSVLGMLVGRINDSTVELRDIKVQNFSINGDVTNGSSTTFGGVIGQIGGSTGGEVRIDGVELINGSISGNGRIGGVVGDIYTTATGPDSVEIRRVKGTDINIHGHTLVGGIVGSSDFSNSSGGRVMIGGVELDNDPLNAAITGNRSTGGILGHGIGNTMQDLLIGKSRYHGDIVIEDSFAQTVGDKVGGIVGYLERGVIDSVEFLGNIDQTAGLSGGVTNVGGVVGFAGSTGLSTALISRSRVVSDITLDGVSVGGVVGSIHGLGELQKSIIEGVFYDGNLNPLTSTGLDHAGGIAGEANDTNILKTIIEGDVSGYTNVGGIVGGFYCPAYSTTKCLIQESVVKGDVEWYGYPAGGLVGLMNNGTHIDSALLRGSALDDETSSSTGFNYCDNAPATNGCGILIGHAVSANTECTHIAADGATIVNTLVNAVTFGDTNAVGIDNTLCNDTGSANIEVNISALNAAPANPYFGTTELLFYEKHDVFYSSTYPNTGTFFDPYQITSRSKWNEIGDDEYLNKAYFELAANIDFTSGFTPIGGNTNTPVVFSGGITNFEGFTLSNITLTNTDFSGVTTDVGMIRKLGDSSTGREGEIGNRGYPLIVDGLSLTVQDADNIGGLVGRMGGGKVVAKVTNGSVTHNTITGFFYAVGGLVGLVEGRSEIIQSMFEGNVTTTGSASGIENIGGLVGSITLSANEFVEVEHSFADVTFASSGTPPVNVGGLVGEVDRAASNGFIYLEKSYAIINEFPAGSSMGGIVGINNSSTSPGNYEALYADFSGVTNEPQDMIGNGVLTGLGTADFAAVVNTGNGSANIYSANSYDDHDLMVAGENLNDTELGTQSPESDFIFPAGATRLELFWQSPNYDPLAKD